MIDTHCNTVIDANDEYDNDDTYMVFSLGTMIMNPSFETTG